MRQTVDQSPTRQTDRHPDRQAHRWRMSHKSCLLFAVRYLRYSFLFYDSYTSCYHNFSLRSSMLASRWQRLPWSQRLFPLWMGTDRPFPADMGRYTPKGEKISGWGLIDWFPQIRADTLQKVRNLWLGTNQPLPSVLSRCSSKGRNSLDGN